MEHAAGAAGIVREPVDGRHPAADVHADAAGIRAFDVAIADPSFRLGIGYGCSVAGNDSQIGQRGGHRWTSAHTVSCCHSVCWLLGLLPQLGSFYGRLNQTHRTSPTIMVSARHGRVGHERPFALSLASSQPCSLL